MLLKPFFFSPYFASQYGGDHLMQGPKLVDRHGFEVEIVVHLTNSDISSVYRHRAVDARRAKSPNLTESRQRRQCRMQSKLLQGAGFLMPKANRVHCTQRRIQIKDGRRRNDRSRNLSTNFTPCRFFNDKDHCTWDVKPTAITRLTARRVNPAKHHIRHDSRGFKNGIVIGFMGVIGSALATVLPKAEPIVPM